MARFLPFRLAHINCLVFKVTLPEGRGEGGVLGRILKSELRGT